MIRKQKKYLRKKAVLWSLFVLLSYALLSIYWQHRSVPSAKLELPVVILRDRPFSVDLRQRNTSIDVSLQHQFQKEEDEEPPPPPPPPQQQRRVQPAHYYPGRKIALQPSNEIHRPALDSLIQGEKIIGDVQFLLDFAIVGFGKAGTSTMMDWLAAHPSVAMFAKEVYDLVHQRPAQLVQSLYEDLPAGDQYLRGYKNPLEISQPHVLEYYRTYWPKTKLICGLRHPVKWFESLYNFRVQNLLPGQEMPDPNHLIGRCYADRMNTCTEKGNFAYSLLWLGKTNESHQRPMSPLVQKIVGQYQRLWFNTSAVPYLSNPVFLYHMEQMQESPQALARDIKSFLDLDSDLPPLPHRKPGLDILDVALQQQKERQKIDICDPAFRAVRSDLLRIGTLGAQWLEEELLPLSSSVHVSDPKGFQKILREWCKDPCENSTITQHVPHRGPPKNDPVIQAVSPLKFHVRGMV